MARDNNPIEVIKFKLKPVNCVTRYQGQECQLIVTLDWQTSRPADICIFQDRLKLTCWKNTQAVLQSLSVKLQQDSTFDLRTYDGKKVLKQQQIKVNFVNQYRRSLRPKWSIF